MVQPNFGGATISSLEEEQAPAPVEQEVTPTPIEQPAETEVATDQPNFGGNTIDSTEPKGGVIDYLLNPREEVKDTEGFKAGEANVNEDTTVMDTIFGKDEPIDPTKPPVMEKSGWSWLDNRNYTSKQTTAYMEYHMGQGKTKNQALTMLRAEGATPLDMSNASYHGMSTKSPSEAATDIGTKAIKRGFARTGLAIADTAVSIAGGLGADTTKEVAKLDFARGQMKAEHDQMEGTYGMQSPMETAVKYAPEVLSFGIAGGAKSVAATEAVVEYGLSRADGYSQGQSLARAATIGIVAGGAERVLNGPNLTNADGLTTEADDLLQYMNIKKGTKEYDQSSLIATAKF